MTSRYLIGIDLGTTNSAVAYIDGQQDPAAGRSIVRTFPVPQLITEGKVATRPLLPSFLYLPGAYELGPGSLSLPWDPNRPYAVGEFARVQGTRVPGRLVSSAKSWLCHSEVNRTAAILPWGAPPEVPKVSPVQASARYLQHMHEAWSQTMGKKNSMEAQDLVLTVPASFDEVARELTLDAAKEAGLPNVRLLEEPQAALYAWLAHHEKDWGERLKPGSIILVFDVGGGTTDFSLIAVQEGKSGPVIERIAVGDHLLLGGDNIDIALARNLEARVTGGQEKLDTQRWHLLANICRAAKEQILSDDKVDQVTVRLPGRGSSIVGGAIGATLTRQEVESLTLDGFFPGVGPDDLPRRGRLGLQEWGLPYASEPEISRHLVSFLKRQLPIVRELEGFAAAARGSLVRPDAILFNGGVFKPAILRERVRAMITQWFTADDPAWQLHTLENQNPDLAVAQGASYYGWVRRGMGLKIGGGSPRAYYIGISGAEPAATDNGEIKEPVTALCLAPRGMEEGGEVHIADRAFEVLTNQPVSFPLYSSSVRTGDKPGAVIVTERGSLATLPPIHTVLRFGKKSAALTIPVRVSSRLTEVGTLELWCESLKTEHRWRMQFQVRSSKEEAAEPDRILDVVRERVIEESSLTEAEQKIRQVFRIESALHKTPQTDPVSLTRLLEETLNYRKESWPLGAIRKIWDVVWDVRAQRALGAEYEARWLNLSGFCLRPGFGHSLDAWRIEQLWKLFAAFVTFPKAVQCRVEWWNLWKRVSGGLSREQQNHLNQQVASTLMGRGRGRPKPGRIKPAPQELRMMWQAVASCERLSPNIKADLGNGLVEMIAGGKASDQEFWSLSRLGARALLYGPIDAVAPRATVENWVERLLKIPGLKSETLGFTLVQLARCVGDRERDLSEDLRRRVADAVAADPAKEHWRRLVLEVTELEARDQARIFDESLPEGLRLVNP